MFALDTQDGVTLGWFTPVEISNWGSHDAEDEPEESLEQVLNLKRQDGHYPDVVASIKRRGFWRPLTATRHPVTGAMKLGDGHHRLAAAVDLGIAHVPILVRRESRDLYKLISTDSGEWYEGAPIPNTRRN